MQGNTFSLKKNKKYTHTHTNISDVNLSGQCIFGFSLMRSIKQKYSNTAILCVNTNE